MSDVDDEKVTQGIDSELYEFFGKMDTPKKLNSTILDEGFCKEQGDIGWHSMDQNRMDRIVASTIHNSNCTDCEKLKSIIFKLIGADTKAELQTMKSVLEFITDKEADIEIIKVLKAIDAVMEFAK